MNITSARDINKSDTEVSKFNWVLVTTTAGSLVYDQEGGNTVTISNMPTGVWTPVGNAVRIRTTSTAVGIVVA